MVRWRSVANALNGSTALGVLVARLGAAVPRSGPHGLVVAHGYRLRFPLGGAFTVGDVVVHRRAQGWLEERPALLAHEERHADQWARCLGLPMLPLYLLAAGWSYARCGDWWSRNPFELRAGLADGGYVARPPRGRPV